uniref:phosphoglycerate kinase n=1 Tax=Stylophora pistillata TaxID=50429 RepID=A0A2B4RXU6_STYPI
MLDKLKIVKQRYDEVSDLIIQPDIISDQKRYVKINKEYKDLGKVMEKATLYENLLKNIEEAKEIIAGETDSEMVEMAKSELEEAQEKIPALEEEIKFLLIPKDTEDGKDVIVEIRAGTGGDEASIFAGDLFRMYNKYASDRGWQIETEDFNEGTAGGFKEIIFSISGEDVYGDMKFESGVHRVQRVPQTETQGRVHTSAATVMVLPQAEEFDIELKQSDIRIDYFCSSGPGGQSVNTTYSAGTIAIAKAVKNATQKGAFSLIGGGDSVAAINQLGFADDVSYVSTGGGALLAYMEGKELPEGLRGLGAGKFGSGDLFNMVFVNNADDNVGYISFSSDLIKNPQQGTHFTVDGLPKNLILNSSGDGDAIWITGTAVNHSNSDDTTFTITFDKSIFAAANRPTSNDEIVGRTLTFKLDFVD